MPYCGQVSNSVGQKDLGVCLEKLHIAQVHTAFATLFTLILVVTETAVQHLLS